MHRFVTRFGESPSTRRTFLQAAGTVAGTVAATVAAAWMASAGSVARGARIEEESSPVSPPLIIDCHAHLYSDDETTYPPIERPYRPPAGDGTLAHLRREMRLAGVRFATIVQTSTFYRWDNRLIAAASAANRDALAGICTLNPDDPQSPSILERYVTESNIRGLRSIPAQSGRLDDPGVEALWSLAERLGITVNVLVNRDKRRELEALARRHPALPVVIDHCLNLSAGREQNAIASDMLALARVPNLHAKLSCVVTGSSEQFPFRDMHGPCRAIIAEYGPERCVWGSDFPCSLWCPKASYAQHLRVFTHELGLDPRSQHHILGETARRLYYQQRSVS